MSSRCLRRFRYTILAERWTAIFFRVSSVILLNNFPQVLGHITYYQLSAGEGAVCVVGSCFDPGSFIVIWQWFRECAWSSWGPALAELKVCIAHMVVQLGSAVTVVDGVWAGCQALVVAEHLAAWTSSHSRTGLTEKRDTNGIRRSIFVSEQIVFAQC